MEMGPSSQSTKLNVRLGKDKSVKSGVTPEVMGHLLWSQTTGVLQMANTKKCYVLMDKINIEDIISGHFKILKSGIKKK